MSRTPSTDEMEENYIYGRYDHGPLETAEDAGDEWDRGIEKVRRDAKAEALREAHVALGEAGMRSENLFVALLDRADQIEREASDA